MDLGCHCIDVLELVVGSRVAELDCFAETVVHSYPVDDTAVATVRFANGALGVVDVSFAVPDEGSRNRLEVYGSRGAVLAEGTIGQSPGGRFEECLSSGEEGYDADQERAARKWAPVTVPEVNTYLAEIEAFSRAVEEDTEPPVVGKDGLWNQRLMDACYRSARDGQRVVLACPDACQP